MTSTLSTPAHRPGQQPERFADAVLAVLADPVSAVPADLDETELSDAIALFTAAGRAALLTHRPDWLHIRLRITVWEDAERIAAAMIGPLLTRAQQAGRIGDWWFLRKAPDWRLRIRPGHDPAEARFVVDVLAGGLLAAGHITGHQPGVYEPETFAFGGPAGIDIAHALFAADSSALLTYLADPADTTAIGRRELSLILCSALFRAAGQDWYEQGDIWHRITLLRPLPGDVDPGQTLPMHADVRRLMTLDPRADGPLGFAAAWADALARQGARLAEAHRDGRLERGIRSVLAHHVIFSWNRIGLPDRTQAILARAARDTIMDGP
ncbi:thiopeptide-type bacteriocin biosynthesis protein [Rhizohabitans arisaemae]|uniref:thiopeptide-type bacteriocin biosynthesis protein n=1 Tax=Rhizohabitans arisaemae TaxID=2720610 RepID=UPI0024B17A3F|nr:thiopeptide-type bacteriocin biosynthesis protein [Rhizohabitans arisaemae]